MTYLYKVKYNPKTNKFSVLANIISSGKPVLTEAEKEDGVLILSSEELEMIDKKNIQVKKGVTIY